MKRLFLTILLASFILPQATPTPAKADALSGNVLHSFCTDTDNSSQIGCIAFVRGVVEGMYWGSLLTHTWMGGKATNVAESNKLIEVSLKVCQPENVTAEQQADIVRRFLHNNPAQRHESARYQVWLALAQAFPCKP